MTPAMMSAMMSEECWSRSFNELHVSLLDLLNNPSINKAFPPVAATA